MAKIQHNYSKEKIILMNVGLSGIGYTFRKLSGATKGGFKQQSSFQKELADSVLWPKFLIVERLTFIETNYIRWKKCLSG